MAKKSNGVETPDTGTQVLTHEQVLAAQGQAPEGDDQPVDMNREIREEIRKQNPHLSDEEFQRIFEQKMRSQMNALKFSEKDVADEAFDADLQKTTGKTIMLPKFGREMEAEQEVRQEVSEAIRRDRESQDLEVQVFKKKEMDRVAHLKAELGQISEEKPAVAAEPALREKSNLDLLQEREDARVAEAAASNKSSFSWSSLKSALGGFWGRITGAFGSKAEKSPEADLEQVVRMADQGEAGQEKNKIPAMTELERVKARRTQNSEAIQAELAESLKSLQNRPEVIAALSKEPVPLSSAEQGDILEYINAHPDFGAKKSIELLGQISRFDENRREVLAASIFGDISFRGQETFLDACRRRFNPKTDPNSPYVKGSFRDMLTRALSNATDDHYTEHILAAVPPIFPWSELEDLAKQISTSDMMTPGEFRAELNARDGNLSESKANQKQ